MVFPSLAPVLLVSVDRNRRAGRPSIVSFSEPGWKNAPSACLRWPLRCALPAATSPGKAKLAFALAGDLDVVQVLQVADNGDEPQVGDRRRRVRGLLPLRWVVERDAVPAITPLLAGCARPGRGALPPQPAIKSRSTALARGPMPSKIDSGAALRGVQQASGRMAHRPATRSGAIAAPERAQLLSLQMLGFDVAEPGETILLVPRSSQGQWGARRTRRARRRYGRSQVAKTSRRRRRTGQFDRPRL